MIDPQVIADRLLAAERDRKEIGKLTDEYPDLDLETAYAAQRLLVEAKVANGEKIVGAKVGLTSRAKQKTMGVSEPIYGPVTSGALMNYGDPVDLDTLIHPRVEPELVFLFGRELAGPTTLTGVLAATEVIFPAIDVLDSRYRDYKFTQPDVVADNCSTGRLLFGPQARRPDELVDLRLLGCVLRADGDVVATAAGAAVLGHPAYAVAWYVNQLAARGESVPAGWFVASGGLTDAVPMVRGRSVVAEFDGLGSVEVYA